MAIICQNIGNLYEEAIYCKRPQSRPIQTIKTKKDYKSERRAKVLLVY